MKPTGEGEAALTPVWVIGLTGHRFLKNPEAVRAKIRQLLEALREEIAGEIVGCSSIAIGADTLFAEACLALKVPWIATLPFSATDFRSDFEESQWDQATKLLQRAVDVQTYGSPDERKVAYLKCGLKTVDEADLLIAVWDREPPRGTGGTAEVVAYARLLRKPLILVHPERLDEERESFQADAFSDPEVNWLNELVTKQPGGPGTKPETAEARVRLFFRKVDAVAARIAPKFRRWVALSLLMNTVAVILGTAVVVFDLHSSLLNLLIFLLVAAATLSIAYVKRKGAHRKWIRCRVAAEVCRSALATWDLPDVVAPLWFYELQTFARLAKSLRLLRLSFPGPPLQDLHGWMERYLRERIEAQIAYFERRSRRLRLMVAGLSSGFWIFSGLAIVRGIFVATVGLERFDPVLGRVVQSFLPIALPLAAGCFLALTSIFDLNRQLTRSREMEKRLKLARAEIRQCENLPALQSAVEKAENLFAGEFFEWFTLFRIPRFN